MAISWTLEDSRPDILTDPYGYEASWDQDIDNNYCESQVEEYMPARLSDIFSSRFAASFATQAAAQATANMTISLFILQQHLSELLLRHHSRDQWLRLDEDRRRHVALNGITRTMLSPEAPILHHSDFPVKFPEAAFPANQEDCQCDKLATLEVPASHRDISEH